ncbi:DEAD/DEAH box helicase family protein [Polaribacter litorisediminis]|uniref:DEAD/DEAH box helicase n=1 Tax=Polaribacter litorisediminis TaxID=1908341 RepID=UPI001CBA8EBE|nr:DEAD/DEAH box helicase family protein [Polaribacter litorisediminis]UAM98750.1 DEAD/DEAH box helicase family protein [Polaribacter litorisediminis]
MSDLKEVVSIADFKVSVQHHFNSLKMVLSAPLFSEVNAYYSNTKEIGLPVKKHHTLNTLLERLNGIKTKPTKSNSIAILKGLYKGGTNGVFCYEGAPYLFFDIDVKENENKHLLVKLNNANVFEHLKKIAVLVWRSNSGFGIAGILFVPQLAEVLNSDRKKHLSIGKAITKYLKEVLNVDADFDNAQNKFRQIRFLAMQKEKRFINTNPIRFSYDVKEVQRVSQTGVKQYRRSDNRAVIGSIEHQFNNDTSIHNALLDNGFKWLNDTRYLHTSTTSKSTGTTGGNNVFFNYSQSFSNYKVFTPFSLYLTQHYSNDLNRFLSDLKKKGYNTSKPQQTTLKQSENVLKQQVKDREKQIFTACYDLINLPYKEKLSFIKKNAKNDAEKMLFFDYLKIKPLNISYNKTLKIQNYVSEQLETVLEYADANTKTILTAETGTGKTTAFLRDFAKHRPGKRILILAPLTAIVEQNKAEYQNIISLTGNSEPKEHTKAKTSLFVMATYEQGYKHLSTGNTFDYVVIDEVHNLITAHEYKRETIKNLTRVLKSCKVIGLTGTTNLLFKSIGYKLINVQKEAQNKVNINLITDNRAPLKIALQHLQNVKGKCIIRVNSRNVAKDLKTELLRLKQYKKDEVLILNSDAHIKKGNDFKQLTDHSNFNESIKLVLTTSIIDEGLSIKQSGFTDVVFIETDYKPMPEAVKQFFARFRNEDADRKNYFYFRETKEQKIISWNPLFDFKNTQKKLKEDAETFSVNDTDKKDSTNTKYLYYEDTSVNDFALAYDVAKRFFLLMTKQEYIHFLELNYNINIIENKTHISIDFDTTESKSQSEENKIQVAKKWLNNKDEVLNALFVITDNLQIKKSIDYIGLQPENEIYNLVSDNLKAFEHLQKNCNRLENLGVNDVDTFLIDTTKIKPFDLRNINRKIKLLENIDTIKNPKTKTDEKNKTKLLTFLSEAEKLKTVNKNTLFVVWNKLRCNSKKPSYYNLIDLLEWHENENAFIS